MVNTLPGYIACHENLHIRSLYHKASLYYQEPHRHYHNIDHLLDLFYDVTMEQIKLTTAQELAIMFHDAVYVPGCPDNEKYSGELLMSILRNDNADKELMQAGEIAARIINDTRKHLSSCPDSDIVLDLDLLTLARTEQYYNRDVMNIRKEYIKFSDSEFNAGRLEFLRNMILNRSTIFCTPDFRRKFETLAIDNMQREIRQREILLESCRD